MIWSARASNPQTGLSESWWWRRDGVTITTTDIDPGPSDEWHGPYHCANQALLVATQWGRGAGLRRRTYYGKL